MRVSRQATLTWLAIFVVGVAVSWWVAVRADRALRDEMLLQVRLVAKALDMHRVKALTGTIADLDSPDYQQLKVQLARVKSADPRCRFAYLFARKPDGTICMLVDNEPAGSKDESPPGQTYEEAPPEFRAVFDTGREFSEGPSADRWGTFVTAAVPLADPGGGTPVAVLGMDIAAGTWGWDVAARAVPSVSLMALLLGAVGIAVAATRQRRALRASEANFRVFFETIGDLIVVAAPDGRILLTNKALERTLGYGAGELAAMGLPDLFPADKRREAEELFVGAARGEREACSLPLVAKGGNLVPAETRVTTGRWNREDAIFAVSKDLSAEQEAQQRFERLFHKNPALMALATLPEETIFDANEAFLETLGYERDEVVGKTADEIGLFVHPEQRAEISSRLEALGTVSSLDLQVRRKDGVVLDGLFSGEVIASLNRRYLLSVMIDVTDQKRAQMERTKLQDQLQQAMKMEAVGRLAGGVAHDFNNLLTGILGNTELARLDLDAGHPLADFLDEVNEAASRAAALTRQLLAFSRKQIIEPKVADLNILVAGLQKMLTRLIGEDVELQTITQPDLWPVMVDSGQMEQVLVNLSVNARDAMPNGGNLTIETSNVRLDETYCERHSQAVPGDYVLLTVSDTGGGMSEEVKGHLFEPFFTTKEKGKGTGLGLSTVYGAVTQSGGTIEVYSELGYGTAFKIYLPRVTGAVGRPTAPGSPGLPRGTETVVLVEDEEAVRLLAERVLERQGYCVRSFPNGFDALAAIQAMTETIDLLVTDVVMPGINGMVLAEGVKAVRPTIKVLFTSGYPESAVAHHGVLDEGIEFLGKPYSPQTLATKVREVLDRTLDPGFRIQDSEGASPSR